MAFHKISRTKFLISWKLHTILHFVLASCFIFELCSIIGKLEGKLDGKCALFIAIVTNELFVCTIKLRNIQKMFEQLTTWKFNQLGCRQFFPDFKSENGNLEHTYEYAINAHNFKCTPTRIHNHWHLHRTFIPVVNNQLICRKYRLIVFYSIF